MNAETFNGLWYIHEPFANRMEGIILPRLAAGFDPFPIHLRQNAAISWNDKDGEFSPVRYFLRECLRNGGGDVAVIPIIGAMSRFGLCGQGNEFYISVLAEAAAEPAVKAVVLKFTSPGGTVDSTEPFADAVANSPKPTIGFVAGMAASAAVFVLSQCDMIIVEDSGSTEMGSIGVLAIHVDQSGAMEKQGIKVTIIRATESVDKMRVNPVEPLKEEILQEIQDSANLSLKSFKGYVRRGRAGKLKSDEVFTAKMYKNKQSIPLGLADRAGTLADAIKIARSM